MAWRRARCLLLALGCVTCTGARGGGSALEDDLEAEGFLPVEGPRGDDGDDAACGDDSRSWGCARARLAASPTDPPSRGPAGDNSIARYLDDGARTQLWSWAQRLLEASTGQPGDAEDPHDESRGMKGMMNDSSDSDMKAMKMKLKDKIKQKIKEKIKEKMKEKAGKNKVTMMMTAAGAMGMMATSMLIFMAKKSVIVSLMTFVLMAMSMLKKGGGGGGGGGGGKCGPCVCNCKGPGGGGGFSAGKAGGGGGGAASYYKSYRRRGSADRRPEEAAAWVGSDLRSKRDE
ncbi:uncharacterized protein LOC134534586 [Bacillus rossius redtenbacheri]|uniref:uncharacterized protein LOC134534586 n=1 Tax=Bacillus rossius redtenbacheri TaxID=93214 RepID=UPI002FDCEA19